MRRLIEYGVKKQLRDTHGALCDGSGCVRAGCDKGQFWRKMHKKVIFTDAEGVPRLVDDKA